MIVAAIEKRIYVGGLHQSVTEDLLRGRFSKFGSVTDASIAKDDQGLDIELLHYWKRCFLY